jgi:hypothetical protein
MRSALVASRIPFWQPAAAALSVALAYGLVSSAPAATAILLVTGAALVLALALCLPPHVFMAGSLAVLVTFQLSAEHPFVFGGIHPFTVSDIVLYTSDVLLALVAVRALAPRLRRSVDWSILDVPTAVAVSVWALVMIAAAVHGYRAGTATESLARLGEQIVYYPILAWGFVRVLREEGVSSTRVGKALAATALAFVGYMALERLTHNRFENPNATAGHLGSVVTAHGVTLHRDYGFYSAYDLYGLAALAAIAYLLFARRSTGSMVAVAGIFVAATALTLVRGIVFGLIIGVALLALLAFRMKRRDRRQGHRLLPLVGLLAIGTVLFWSISPSSAQGVAQRFLPAITAQSQSSAQTAQYRQQALAFGLHEANAHPFGNGLVSTGSSPQGLAEAGYLAHSAWATILFYTGWLGFMAFLASAILLVRRSARLPDAPGWLKPFFLATLALFVVEAFGSDSIVGQPWVLGEAALVISVRFGLADLDD